MLQQDRRNRGRRGATGAVQVGVRMLRAGAHRTVVNPVTSQEPARRYSVGVASVGFLLRGRVNGPGGESEQLTTAGHNVCAPPNAWHRNEQRHANGTGQPLSGTHYGNWRN